MEFSLARESCNQLYIRVTPTFSGKMQGEPNSERTKAER